MNKSLIKDKAALLYISELENELSVYKNSPIVKSYLTIHAQITDINQQLTNGKIDIFSDKEDKGFDRMKIYFDRLLDWHKTLTELRKLMTDEEKEDLDSHQKISENSLLEKRILQKKNNS